MDPTKLAKRNLDCMSSLPGGPTTLEGYAHLLPRTGESGDGQLSPEEEEQLETEARQDEQEREGEESNEEDDEEEEEIFSTFAHKMSLKENRESQGRLLLRGGHPPYIGLRLPHIDQGREQQEAGHGSNNGLLRLHDRSRGRGSLLSSKLY